MLFFFLDYNMIEAALHEPFYSKSQEPHKI